MHCIDLNEQFPKCGLLLLILLMEDIRRSPVEVGTLTHYLQGFVHPRWCKISSINSRSETL